MKNNNKLITVLYILSRLGFRIILLFIILAVFFEFFTPNGEIGTFSIGAHHSKGYAIKARIHLIIPDTLIVFKSINSNSSGFTTKTENLKLNEDFNKIKKDNQLHKTYQINSFTIYKDGLQDVSKQIENVKIQGSDSEINIVINPKNIFFKLVLMLKNYLALALYLFICYQCMQLFNQLKKNFVFDKILIKRIQNIGFSLIIFQVIGVIVSIFTTQNFSRIDYYRYIPSIDNSRFRFMNLEPYIEYNIETLFLGLSLIVLAKLLSYGLNLQQENDLMI